MATVAERFDTALAREELLGELTALLRPFYGTPSLDSMRAALLAVIQGKAALYVAGPEGQQLIALLAMAGLAEVTVRLQAEGAAHDH